MIWIRGALATSLLAAPALAQDPHEVSVHHAPTPADVMVITRQRAAALGAAQGPDVAIAEAPREAAERANRTANPLVVTPATTTVNAGWRWGNVGAGVEVTGSVVQPFSVRQLGAARADSAKALTAAVESGVRDAKLRSAERALLAWVDALAAKSVHDLRADARENAEQLVAIATRRVRSGVAEPLELALAQGEQGTALAAELEAEGTLTVAQLALRRAVGFAPDRPLAAQGQLDAFEPLTPSSAAPENHPELQHARAAAELAHHDANVAGASNAPTWGLGASYQHEGTSDQVVMGIVQLPVPFGDFGGYARARQDVQASQLARQAQWLQREIAFRQTQSAHEREHARATYDALVHGAREPLREALRLSQLRWEKGPGDLATVLVARQRLVTAEERVVTAAAEVQRADVRHAANLGTLEVR